MSWDVVITGGLVFDGSGGAPCHEDVAIADGRVAARGPDLPRDGAATVIEATGRWVTPGLLDIHTHVDLELEIDPTLSEVVRHGTTTAVMSNCSLGLAFGAQLRDGENPIVDCFARVENIPKHVLQQVVDRVDWDGPAGYLDHLKQLPLGVNVVPMVPHSMLRAEVMGLEGSVSRDPSGADVERMEQLVDEAMRLGYAGFSTDALPFHYLANDPHRQKKIPSQWTTREELRRLVEVLRRYDRVWQATPPKDDPVETLRTFLLSAGGRKRRPVKLTAVAALDIESNRSLLRLGKALAWLLNTRLVNGHFRLQALAAPFRVWGDGPITPQFEEIETLRRLNEPDLEDADARRAILDDPAWQAAFRAMWNEGKDLRGASGLRRRLRVEDYTITRDLDDMVVDGNEPVAAWDGETFGAIFRRAVGYQLTGEGARDTTERAAFDAMPHLDGDEAGFLIHLFRTYDLALRWYMVSANRDPAKLKHALFHDRFLPGFNDSGAHLTNMAFYDANLRGIKLASEEGLERVARHVRRLTREPAELFGLEVGTLDLGAPADVTVIDPGALMTWDPEATYAYIWRDDYQHHQVVNRPDGVVTDVVVGGRHVWHDGAGTDALGQQPAGTVLTVT